MLAEDQSAICRALLDCGVAPSGVTGSNERAARFLGVHRRNVRVSLTGVLAAAFPATRVLLGDKDFEYFAAAFIQAHPPARAEMFAYGDGFPAFLGAIPQASADPRAPALASFEWLRQIAYFAEDAPPLAIQAVRDVPLDEYPYLRFRFHPSARIAVFPVPVVRLWRMFRAGRPLDEGPRAGSAPILVMRAHMIVHEAELGTGAAALLTSLANGATLIEAADSALDADPSFDAQAVLAEHLSLGTFTALYRPPGGSAPVASTADH